MADIIPIFYDLNTENPSMAELAYASGNILDRFNGAASIIARCRYGPTVGADLPFMKSDIYELPISSRLVKEPKVTYVFRRALADNIAWLATVLTEYTKIDLCELLSIREFPATFCGHFTKYVPEKEAWLHFLSRSYSSESRDSGTHVVMAIMELENNDRSCRFERFLSDSAKISDTKVQFSRGYRTFIDSEILDESVTEGSDLEDFLFFASMFDAKLQSLSFVNRELYAASWRTALRTGSRRTDFPWESGDPPGARIPTATVSLDLRRSTSLMDQAENREAFAVWLESLSEICREITHDNHGIFDKFTGDGIIAHFADAPMAETAMIPGPVVRAFTCGCELIRAVDIHLDALRPYLRFNIAASRPAVGMAFDEAAWSLDRDGRPIVVGKGVVNACGLHSGDAGWIQMAYNMKRHLADAVAKDVCDGIAEGVVERHKGLKPDLQPECFRITNADINLGRSRGELGKIVERISAQVKEDHDDSKRLLAANGR